MQGTPEKEADWVFSPSHLRGPGENPLPPWAPGIPAISGLRVYLPLRLVRGWGRLRKTPEDHPQPHRASLPLHPQGQMVMWSPARGSDPGLRADREHRPRSGSIGPDHECIPHATLPLLAGVLWGPPPGKESRDGPGRLVRRRGSPAGQLRGRGPRHMLRQGFLGLLRAHCYPRQVFPQIASLERTGSITSRDTTHTPTSSGPEGWGLSSGDRHPVFGGVPLYQQGQSEAPGSA